MGSSGGGGSNSAMMNMMMLQMIQQQQQFDTMMAEQQASRAESEAARAEAKASMPVSAEVLKDVSGAASAARADAQAKAGEAASVSRTNATSPQGLTTTANTNPARLVGSSTMANTPIVSPPLGMTGSSALAALANPVAAKKSLLGA